MQQLTESEEQKLNLVFENHSNLWKQMQCDCNGTVQKYKNM